MTANQLTVFPAEPILAASTIHQTEPSDQPALPNDWQWVKLSDAVTLSSEKYQPKGETEYYVGLEHIEKGTGRISERAQVEPISTVKNSFRAGEILYGKLRPYLNKVALAVCDGVCSTDILVLRPKETVAARYVHYFMLRDKFVNDMSANSMGVNLPRVPTKYVLGYSFPLPLLAEQQRIVAKIEELFSEIDAGIREIETALKQLKFYRQAVYHHLLNNESWERAKLGEIAKVSGGITKNSKRDSLALQVPYLRVANVYANRLDLAEIKEIGVVESEIERTLLKFGDLLVVEGNGSIEQVGRVAVWKDEIPYCLHQNHLIKIRFKNPAASTFLLTWLLSPLGREAIERQASSTSGLHTLSISKIAGLIIPFPDLHTQTRIVQEIEARLSEADALENTLRTELLRAERLRQSVLKQAFTGKLQKTDVPASLPA